MVIPTDSGMARAVDKGGCCCSKVNNNNGEHDKLCVFRVPANSGGPAVWSATAAEEDQAHADPADVVPQVNTSQSFLCHRAEGQKTVGLGRGMNDDERKYFVM